MCRDGPRSGPDNICCEAENLGPLRAPSRHKAAPTGICTWLGVNAVEVGAGLPAKGPQSGPRFCGKLFPPRRTPCPDSAASAASARSTIAYAH
ncbi:protein of unknown function [Pseudomonas sp. JV551A1]|uniref:Uncharacterized protein n=1 Tax=Pseudomonas inefficax TaxID=2078786 RepID=A0AAQ1SVK4_9PSED|nr:protein of unknown function [Pseudomonas sp. JV551A1]SPO62953.1 protein of unknown function [Pseudomonas inefficax]